MKNTSPDELIEQDEVELCHQEMPEWIIPFIQNTFFGCCEEHKFQKNELNKYCITCDSAACKYCVLAGNHDDHILLKIYRHVYKDVVPLREIECYLNCSKIQSYKCNKIWVIALTPLPHNGSGSQIAENETCQTCKRRLYDPDKFRFCSISCQVEAFNKKNVENVNSHGPEIHSRSRYTLPLPSNNYKDRENMSTFPELFALLSDQDEGDNNEDADEGIRRKRKRKGKPCRAPFM